MDLTTHDTKESANEGAVMPIRDRKTQEPALDDAGKPMWIRLLGIDSDVQAGTARKVTNRRLQIQYERGGKYRPQAEDFDADALTQLVKCTVAWHIQLDTKFPECNEEEVRKVYQRFPWLKEDAENFREDRANFFAFLKPNSLPMQNGQHPARDE